MARELTQEQKAEIVRRYEAGETATFLGAACGIDRRTISRCVAAAGKPMRPASKLTPAEREEVQRRYEAGETTASLGALFGVSAQTIGRALKHAGAMRTGAESAALSSRTRRDLREMSRQAWYSLYCGPDKLGVCTIARRLECSAHTVRRLLALHKIALRGHSEQMAIDTAAGRHAIPTAPPELWRYSAHRGSPEALAKAQRVSAWRRHMRARVTVYCAICGKEIVRTRGAHGRSKQATAYACSRQHGALIGALKGRGRALPHLKELLRQCGKKTYDELRLCADRIGAGEPEIEAVLLEGRR